MAGIVDRLKWLEPTGQALIITAIGLQLYFIDPAAALLDAGRRMKATPADCPPITLKNQTTGEVHTFPMQVPCLQKMLPDVLITAGESQKRTYKSWYAILYLLGGVLAIAGKSASVKASIK